ncbi:MAG TPA: N,N-dimethylformamidase beta subunit family domain-containing protein [Thermomicrobiales bacterium]|nr:N,N-dimethylformamidase beta subunit family domain-containing protein [Thermomicrobiales bacterium]
MLVGYVSDEWYVALPDALVEFERDGRTVAVARTTPRGAVLADIAPGRYRATLAKGGYGSKRVDLDVAEGGPYQFRLLSDRLLGYAWPKWVRAGERAEFRVHAVEPFQLSLWRYGYRKEFVRLLGWHDEHGPRAMMQITPDGDYTQTGVGWNKVGYGSPHHTQLVAGPARSGLYYFHARGESGAFFSFPWVVAPATPTAPIAVLASTNTWTAYNNFGGRSNYVNSARLPDAPIVNARQDLLRYRQESDFREWKARDEEYAPLSSERPELGNFVPEGTEVTDPIAGRQTCHLAPAEWRLLGWLEREGFGYDLYADEQLHSGALDLDAYRILILSTHPEYWSRAMYRRVKEWVYERGGRLMYLGGNGLNCEIEYLDPATLRFKTHLASGGGELGMVDPDNPDIYYESRFHRAYESEANLLGVVTTDKGIMTAAPYRVADAGHWVFAGTGLRDGDLFGAASLHERCHGGASGHETDKMSPSSPPNAALLAKGVNPDEGGAEMVYYDLPNGGAVFSVGSITYPASLLVDERVSRVTANVLARFLAG